MPIQTSWYDAEKTVLMRRVEGRWTPGQIAETLDSAQAMIEDGSLPMCFLWDFRQAAAVPSGLLSRFPTFSQQIKVEHEYLTIFVGVPQSLKLLIELATIRNIISNCVIVQTMEQADEKVAMYKQKLGLSS